MHPPTLGEMPLQAETCRVVVTTINPRQHRGVIVLDAGRGEYQVDLVAQALGIREGQGLALRQYAARIGLQRVGVVEVKVAAQRGSCEGEPAKRRDAAGRAQ